MGRRPKRRYTGSRRSPPASSDGADGGCRPVSATRPGSASAAHGALALPLREGTASPRATARLLLAAGPVAPLVHAGTAAMDDKRKRRVGGRKRVDGSIRPRRLTVGCGHADYDSSLIWLSYREIWGSWTR